MITQNSKGQIILPPVYHEELVPRSDTKVPSAATAAYSEDLNVSAGIVALILLVILVLTTILYYRNSIKGYKNTPEKKFVDDINDDPRLTTKLKS